MAQLLVGTPYELEAVDDTQYVGGQRAVVADLYPTGRFILARFSSYSQADYSSIVPTRSGNGQWVNESQFPGMELELSTVRPAVVGLAGYFVPVGNVLFDAPGMFAVDVDNGSGFVPFEGQVTVIHRGDGNLAFAPPVRVRDAAIGLKLDAGAATSVRLRWKERRLPFEIPSISKVRVINGINGWVLDDTVIWHKESGLCTNGLQLASLPDGYQWEFWRRTEREGGLRTKALHGRDGRRYVPYERFTPPDTGLLLHWRDFNHKTGSRSQFKLAIYDPATGARSRLSDLTVCVNPRRDAVLLASSANPRNGIY